MSITSQTVPGPKGLPLIGNLLQMGKDPMEFWLEAHASHGDVIKARLGPINAFSFASPQAMHEVLVTKNKIMSKGFGYASLRRLLGEGLISTDMPHWADQRQRLNPLFTPSAIEGYAGAVYQSCARAIAELAPEGEKTIEHDLTEATTRVTTRVISGAAFGVDLAEDHQDIADAINYTFAFITEIGINPLKPPLFVPTAKNRLYKAHLARIEGFISALIEQARQSPDARSMSGQIFAALIDNDHTRLRDEVISLYFAGYETTARTMAFAIHLLARHPEIFVQVREEAKNFSKPEDALSVLRQLPVCSEVVNETLRLYPPVAMLARQPTQDCDVLGVPVKKNDLIVLLPYLAQRNPDFWPYPDRFTPDAQQPLAKRLKHRGAFVPFGAGPRVCLGKHFALVELAMAIALFAKNFDWETSGPDWPDIEFAGTIRPKDAISVRFSRRKA